MNKLFISLLISFLVLLFVTSTAQDNFLNGTSVYEFLDRQEIAGRISINHHQKPYTRRQISDALSELNSVRQNLNSTELAELNYFLSEYGLINISSNSVESASDITLLGDDPQGAFRFLSFAKDRFNFTIYPDIGVTYTIRDENKNKLLYYNILSGYGNIGNHFSFDFKFNDFSIKSNNYPINSTFSPYRGFDYLVFRSNTETHNFDRTRAAVTFSWDWGFASFKKDYNYWGTGYNGRLIFSDKAPSFPQFQLKLFPSINIEFNYFHGELNSMIYDSTSFRDSPEGTRDHIQLVPKYIAAHIITFNVFDNLRLSLGESVVYSDRFEPIYLVPFLFFRMADHYLSKTDYNSGNAQIFSSVSYKLPSINTRFDASLFIDEISISDIGGDRPTVVGYSFGIKNYHLFLDNFGVELEYTRINPAVYEHADPAQRFSNRSYGLGHWMGSNADQIFIAFSYKPSPLLFLKSSFEYTRKGDFEDSSSLNQPGQTFLHGDVSYFNVFRFYAGYELVNNLFLETEIGISNSYGANNLIDIRNYKFQEFSAGFRYGLD